MKNSSHHAPRDESGESRGSTHSQAVDEASVVRDPALLTRSMRATLASQDIDGCGLRLDLLWQHDRYSHRIVTDDGTPLLSSIEGSDEDIWPPSPPLQQLSIEEIRPGIEVALLVGMAGKSHWSVSIEPQPDRTGFIFDVACRLRELPASLGSRYELHEADATRLEMTGLDVGRATLVETGAARWAATPDTEGALGNTIRWKYSISLN